MAAANFGLMGRRWLYSVLENDAELEALGVTAVRDHPGGGKLTHPFITIGNASPFLARTDYRGGVMHAEGSFTVRVNGRTNSFEDIAPVAARINELLQDRINEDIPKGGILLSCQWRQDFDDRGDDYRALGGVFRLEIQAP